MRLSFLPPIVALVIAACTDSADVFPLNEAAKQIGSPKISFVRTRNRPRTRYDHNAERRSANGQLSRRVWRRRSDDICRKPSRDNVAYYGWPGAVRRQRAENSGSLPGRQLDDRTWKRPMPDCRRRAMGC